MSRCYDLGLTLALRHSWLGTPSGQRVRVGRAFRRDGTWRSFISSFQGDEWEGVSRCLTV
jgi:hypothetical protein